MLLLLHAISTWVLVISSIYTQVVYGHVIISCSLQFCSFSFWHYHPYILQQFNEMFFTLVSPVFSTCYYNVATRKLSYSQNLLTKYNIPLFDHKEVLLSV